MQKEHRILIKSVHYGFGRYEVRLQQRRRFLFWLFWDTLSNRKFCNRIDADKLTLKWQEKYQVNIIDKTE